MSDEEWAFAARYLALITPNAPSRTHPLWEVRNARRGLARNVRGTSS